MYTRTDFKFIGKVESQTNSWTKNQILLILHDFFLQKSITSIIYMPNYSGKKTCSLIHGLSRFFDYWPLQNRAFSPTLWKLCWNATIWRSCGNFFFFFNIHKKCIWYQFKIFSQKYAHNKKERNFWPQGIQIAAFQQSFSQCWWNCSILEISFIKKPT